MKGKGEKETEEGRLKDKERNAKKKKGGLRKRGMREEVVKECLLIRENKGMEELG